MARHLTDSLSVADPTSSVWGGDRRKEFRRDNILDIIRQYGSRACKRSLSFILYNLMTIHKLICLARPNATIFFVHFHQGPDNPG